MQTNEKLIREVNSDINQKLRIVWEGDKKLLNTENTNYSYGTLVDVLEYGIDTLPLSMISSILLLGMGGGSIVRSLRQKYDCHAPVVTVELDPVVIDIAHKDFNIEDEKELEIHEADAWDFIENCQSQFDLIIIDIFIDVDVPKKFYNPQFWSMIEKNVSQNGFILFNAGIDLTEDEVFAFLDTLPESFIYQENYNVLETNTVIIMQKVF